jgi:hypothetical protein
MATWWGCLDRVPDLEVKLGNYSMRDTFYVVDLDDTDVVLGVQWLITLGNIYTNYQILEMGFRDNEGKKVVLRGMLIREPRKMSAKRMERIFWQGEATNALFRRPTTCSLMEVSVDWKSHLLVEYSKNKFACEILDGKVRDKRYKVMDDVIFYKDRVYLVPRSSLKKKIFAEVHDSPLAGHQGFFKTYRQVRERLSWKGLKQDVMRHISECVTCQQNKSEQTLPAGLLRPLPIPEQKWEWSSMYFITSLLKAQGKDDIFVGVEILTKFTRFLAIPTKYNTVNREKCFFKETFRLHGLPQGRLDKRSKQFTSISEEIPPLDEEG